MTAQIEPNPRPGVELRAVLRRLCAGVGRAARWVGRWLWARREGLCAVFCYLVLYALALALTYREPVYIGLAGFLAAIAAIVGHCLSEVANVRDR